MFAINRRTGRLIVRFVKEAEGLAFYEVLSPNSWDDESEYCENAQCVEEKVTGHDEVFELTDDTGHSCGPDDIIYSNSLPEGYGSNDSGAVTDRSCWSVPCRDLSHTAQLDFSPSAP